MQLWRPQKKWLFFWLLHTSHSQKWTIDLLLKSKKACKHASNFKISSTLFCMDIINVWFVIGNNFKTRKWWRDERLQKLNPLFHSNTFFWFVPQNKIYQIRIKKQCFTWLRRCLIKMFRCILLDSIAKRRISKLNQKPMLEHFFWM